MGIVGALENGIAHAGWLAALAPFAALAYLAPALIAFERRHRFLWTIAVLNVAAGWTLLGWVAALIWAVNKDVRPLTEELPAPVPDAPLEPRWNPAAGAEPVSSDEFKHCPFCAEAIRAEAIVCRYCSRDLAPLVPVKPAADLDQHEKRRLQTLLVDAPEREPDPALLDVFEYARLLEAEESGAVLTLVPGAQSEAPPAGTAPSWPQPASRLEWDDDKPEHARVAARR